MKNQKSKITLVVDWNPSAEGFWLKDELEKLGFEVKLIGLIGFTFKDRTIKWRKILLWIKYLLTGLKTIKLTKKGEIIISWNFIIGSYIAFVAKLLHIDRKILSLNLIAHQKGFFNELLRNIVYKQAFVNDNFYATVNSQKLIDKYNESFKSKSHKYFVLNDPYDPESEIADFQQNKSFVFAGGEAARDWNLLFEVAQRLPEISFKIIVRRKYFNIEKKLPNVSIEFDTSLQYFYQKMKESSLVVISLNSDAPSGILVLHRAALLSKPIIATETSITKTYITNNENGILIPMHDVNSLKNGIKNLFNNQDLSKEFATNLNNRILNEYSPQHYTHKLVEILNKIK